MSVAAQLELADPERYLLGRARGQWTVWSERCPRLRVVDDLLNLPAWIAAADKGEVDRVLWELARLASPSGGDDVAAAGALAWLLLPGACATAHRLRSLTPRIDEVVAAQLWLEVREFPWQRLGKVAANIVMNVRRGVLRELGVGSHLEEVDPAWSRAVPLPPEAHQWEVLGATHDHAPLDPADELDEVLGRAVAQRVIDEHDRDLLISLAYAADAAIARGGRGQGGLCSREASREVAAERGVSERTMRRRVHSGMRALQAVRSSIPA